MPIIEIHHDDMIINYDRDNPTIFSVTHKCFPHNLNYYRLKDSAKVKDEYISVYKLCISNPRLPAFITITETDIDIIINHTLSNIL